jgi:hypothetical protein
MDKDPDSKARVEVELLQFDNANAFQYIPFTTNH